MTDEGDPPKPTRVRLGAVAKLVLMTRPPLCSDSRNLEYRQWKAAFDELVLVHGAQLEEIEDLLELLDDARDTLEYALKAGEQGYSVDVGEIRLTIEAITKEIGQ